FSSYNTLFFSLSLHDALPIFPRFLGLDRADLVDRLAEHVHDPAQRRRTHRHRHRTPGVLGHQVALEAVGGTQRDRAHHAIAELLLHLEGDLRALHLQRVVHLRHVVAWELDVDDGADDLDDLALVAHVGTPLTLFDSFVGDGES